MGKPSELLALLKTGNSDAARKLIAKLKKSGKKKSVAKDLNVPDDSGQTVIHHCAANNFIEFLQDLSELGAIIDSADDQGYTPLHVASQAGRTSAVSALLNQGADPNTAARSGDTPLHVACLKGHPGAVEVLISEHANCTMLNVTGHTPLDLACQNGHPQVVSLLLSSGQLSQAYLSRSDMPHTALLLAAKQGHNEVIGLLVRHGFDINKKLPGSNGTCLHEAALYGKVDTVRYLLQCGADVQAMNGQGHTALDIVNMYTDPRSAGLMKKVLQDALAHQARARMAHHHQQQPPPHQQHPSGHQQHPSGHQQHPSGHQQHPSSHQQHMYRGPPTPTQAHHPSPTQGQQTPPTPTSSHHHQGFSYLQFGAQASPKVNPQRHGSYDRQQHQQQTHHQQAHHQQTQQQAHHQQAHHQQAHHQQTHHQQAHHQQAHQQAHHQQAHHQPSPAQASRPHMERAHTYAGQQEQHGYYQQRQPHDYRQQSSHDPAHFQQQQPGVQAPSIGLAGAPDLASMIAAKAASRKPIVTSPTRKDFADDERVGRSSTISRDIGISDARQLAQQAVLRRRSSFSDRSSASPEREQYNPPTLPRRSHGGPPQFKPVPPPADMDPVIGYRSEFRQSQISNRSDSPERGRSNSLPRKVSQGTTGAPEVTRLKKTSSSRPPPPPETSSVDNELMQKLMRRQNRIQQAEQNPELFEDKPQEPEEPEAIQEPQEAPAPQPTPSVARPAAGKPPPIPERKTAQLTQPEQPVVKQEKPAAALREMSPPHEAPHPQPKPKPKPPPVRPKEAAPGLTPWQEELQARKQRKATSAVEAEMKQNIPEDGQPEEHDVIQPEEEPLPPPPAFREPPVATKEPPPPPAAKPQPPPPAPKEPPPPPAPKEPPPPPAPKPQAPPPVAPKEPPPPPVAPKEPPPPPVAPKEPPPPPVAPKEPPPPPVAPKEPAQPLETPAAEVEEDLRKAPEYLKMKPTDLSVPGVPSTPTSDHLSRSTSVSSLSTTTGTASPLQFTVEAVPIGDWLGSYKLQDYIPLFEAQGYDNTEFISGISQEELMELGVQKIGHRKKILTALTSVLSRENFLAGTKPPSISAWLSLLGLSEYEEVLLDAGYDDIDFIADITTDELIELGITKKGHLKRFVKGIGELAEILPPTPSPVPPLPVISALHINGPPESEGHKEAPLPTVTPTTGPDMDAVEIATRPRQDSTGQNSYSRSPQREPAGSSPQREPTVSSKHREPGGSSPHREPAGSSPQREPGGSSFIKMKHLLEARMGIGGSRESLETSEEGDSAKVESRSPSGSPQVARRAVKATPPPPVPRRAVAEHSLSSSTSSLASNISDRLGGSTEVNRGSAELHPIAGPQAEQPPPIPPKLSQRPARATETTDGQVPVKSYSIEDITAALDDEIKQNNMFGEESGRDDVEVGGGSEDDEMNQLSRALEGFEPETGQSNKPGQEPEAQTDQLLADIDGMLADLNVHLDFMIPESS